MLVAHNLARAVLAGDLAPLIVECVAVGVASRIAEAARDVIVLLEKAQLLIIRDIAPQQIPSDRVPGRAFGPQRAGVQPLDRRVAQLVLEALVDLDDVRIRIADRLVAAEIARKCLRRHGGGCRKSGGCGQKAATVKRGVARRHVRLRCRVDESVQLHACHERPPDDGCCSGAERCALSASPALRQPEDAFVSRSEYDVTVLLPHRQSFAAAMFAALTHVRVWAVTERNLQPSW
jgi:hypothetical protein